jgi:threonine/homoserine/homoserine lactone efflux protein
LPSGSLLSAYFFATTTTADATRQGDFDDLTDDLQLQTSIRPRCGKITPVGTLAAFVGVAALVIVMPGPDTALTIRNALLGGRRSGLFTAAGVSVGQAIWTLAASAGIAALLIASRPAFLVLKYVGAAYLVWLGLQALRAAVRGTRRPGTARGAGGISPRPAFRQGVVSNLANPKMAMFFTSLLPQFGSSFAELLALGLLFASMTFMWLAGYGAVVAKAGAALGGPVRRALDAVTGAILVGLGLRLATERR